MNKKYIQIGPSLKKGNLGGVTLPFYESIEYINNRRNGCDQIIIEVEKSFFNITQTFYSLMTVPSGSVIIFHATWRSSLLLLPILYLTKKLKGHKVYLRKFAGDFDLRLNESSIIIQIYMSYILKRLDKVFFETKYLVNWARQMGCQAEWWPNSRKFEAHEKISNRELGGTLRFIFLGRVCSDKGIYLLPSIMEKISPKAEIDIWGAIEESELNEMHQFFAKSPGNINYKGILQRDEIYSVLSNYDFLILPTSWRSEGYPGVIIEAALVGVPSVVSNSRGPAELVGYLGGWKLDQFINFINNSDLSDINKIKSDVRKNAIEMFDTDLVNAKIMAEIL